MSFFLDIFANFFYIRLIIYVIFQLKKKKNDKFVIIIFYYFTAYQLEIEMKWGFLFMNFKYLHIYIYKFFFFYLFLLTCLRYSNESFSLKNLFFKIHKNQHFLLRMYLDVWCFYYRIFNEFFIFQMKVKKVYTGFNFFIKKFKRLYCQTSLTADGFFFTSLWYSRW